MEKKGTPSEYRGRSILVNDPGILLPDRPIAFNRQFVFLGIKTSGALFLSQAIYWDKRTSGSDGWFYKTIEDWEEETGLTRDEQMTVKKTLVSKGYIEIEKRGIPAKNFFRLNKEKIALDLVVKCFNLQSSDFPTTSGRDSLQQEVGIPDDIPNTETTTENTTKKATTSLLVSAFRGKGIVTGDQYQPDGKRPKRAKRTRTPAQEEAFQRQLDLDKFIVHYRQEAKRVHGLSYLDREEDLNPKIRRQFSNAYSKIGDELMDFIDWVMADTETWHSYDPENCVTDKMIRHYRNRDAIEKLKPKSKKQRILVLGKKGGEEK